jgi:decaheme cytochrome c component MtrC/MtrF-like protein
VKLPPALALAAALLALPLAAAGPSNDDCLACHSDATLKRENGRALAFSPDAYAASVHGKAGASCTDCHQDLATATDFPHAEKLAKVDCAPCHSAQADDYEKSFHAESRRRSPQSRAARCADCHGTHEILSPKDSASKTNHFNLPATCLACHANPAIYTKAARLVGNDPKKFADSIHGRALMQSGLKVAPNCATCHGYHEIRRPSDPASTVYRTKVPSMCGTCHSRIDEVFEKSVHGMAVKKGNPKAPVCIDCHTAHAVKRTELASWRLSLIEECGTCHARLIDTYRDTYHGQVTALGFTRVAACADCHGAHDILGPDDPRSSVSPARRLETCRKCHAGATANFARYDPHADARDRRRNPVLFHAARFMRLLLAVVFGFFGLHTALWLPRSFAARREKSKENGNGGR